MMHAEDEIQERENLLGEDNHRIQVEEERKEDILMTFKIRNSFLYRCIITSAFGSLLLGYDLGIIAGALVPMQKDLGLTDFQVEMVTSSIVFASIIGSVIAGMVADNFGRKLGLLAAAVIFFGGSLGMALSFTFGSLLFWRCITGIAVGMGLVINPIFCAELAPRRERGRLTSFNELFINVGLPIAYFAGLVLRGVPDDWRWMLASGAIPAGLLAVATLLLPESPAYLLKNGKTAEASIIIQNLVSQDESPVVTEKVVFQTLVEIKKDMQSNAEMASWGDMMSSKSTRKSLFIGLGFSILTQLPGIDSMVFYSVHTLSNFGVAEKTALTVTLFMGLCKLFFTGVTAALVDKGSVGRRRPVLLGGFFGVVASAVMAGAAYYGYTVVTERLVIFGMLLFVSAFGIGYGPMCWLILAEIFQGPYRSKGMSLGSVVNRLGSFLVASTYLSLVGAIGYGGTFTVYMCIGIVSLLFSYFFVPDLTGKTMGVDDSIKEIVVSDINDKDYTSEEEYRSPSSPHQDIGVLTRRTKLYEEHKTLESVEEQRRDF